MCSGPAGLWILLLGLTARLSSSGSGLSDGRRYLGQAVGLAGTIVLSLALGLHLLPGFHNPRLMDAIILTPDAAPYSVWLNFDETLAGIVVLASCCTDQLHTPWPSFRLLSRAALTTIATIVVAVLLSVALGYARWEPKWTSQFWLWAAVNLFTTCVSEEVFFRGLLQTRIAAALRRFRWGAAAAIAISAGLFGLAHFAGGWKYVSAAGVAGVGYGLVLQQTRRLELSIFAHFLLNTTHFLLFTYPYLA
jgi:uncharacterized protein